MTTVKKGGAKKSTVVVKFNGTFVYNGKYIKKGMVEEIPTSTYEKIKVRKVEDYLPLAKIKPNIRKYTNVLGNESAGRRDQIIHRVPLCELADAKDKGKYIVPTNPFAEDTGAVPVTKADNSYLGVIPEMDD